MSAPYDEARTLLAFVVAPLVVPLISTVYFRVRLANMAFPYTFITSTLVAYLGSLAFGLPIYRFLRARKLTAFWIAPVAGFIAGAMMWYVFLALFGLLFGYSISYVLSGLGSRELPDALRLGGISGASVGTIFWLLARPDRQTQ